MNSNPHAPQSENKLTSEHFDELKEALEVLYVIANISGRNHFAKKWPLVAAHVFGAALSKSDQDGLIDKETRAALEMESEERRVAFLEMLDGLEDKSVKDGALQIEYVQGVVQKLGRDVSLLIYGAQIVDRFIAPPPKPAPAPDEAVVEAVRASADAQEPPMDSPVNSPVNSLAQPSAQPAFSKPPEKDIPLITEDPMDLIKPIDMGAAPPVINAPAASAAPKRVQQGQIQQVQKQGESSKTQRPVSMKFVSSKDQKNKDDKPDS